MTRPADFNPRPHRRQQGVAAVLAMMFLVIFGSLAAAMAIVSQGNLSTADAHLKVNRSLATAETGMNFLEHHLKIAARQVKTREGDITPAIAEELWDEMRIILYDQLASSSPSSHNLQEPVIDGKVLRVGPIAIGAGEPTFTATIQPHPLPGENYNASYYQRPPYDAMAVSAANPMDARFVRVRVVAGDGPESTRVYRSIAMDFQLTKRIPYAILSRSRVMIGRNVVIEGPVGSTFMETHLNHGHPVQMVSDFRGLHPDLDATLDAFLGDLISNDHTGDNRLNLAHAGEIDGITDPEQYDINGDGFIDEFDIFLAHFGQTDPVSGRVQVTRSAMEAAGVNPVDAQQLMELLDVNNDGVIDALDNYAKIRGHVAISADLGGWNQGAADGTYQDYFQGPIIPDFGTPPLTFQAQDNSSYQFEPSDFDVQTFRAMTESDVLTQAVAQYDPNATDPDAPGPVGALVHEEVPYGAAHPYDHYERPVFENMTFENVFIPKGTNALFRNCTFIGVTFIETATNNTDPHFNYAGMTHSDGTLKHPGRTITVDGQELVSSKSQSNNLRFDNCTFEGAIITDAPNAYTHVRNKLTFTGATRFEIDDSSRLTEDQKQRFRRSTILAPHYSIEMGDFMTPYDPEERMELSGTIVAGVIDIRGRANVDGTILTTFQPTSGEGPVIGESSPNFNTTLGYFGPESGDMEAEVPAYGMGVIRIRYNPTLPLPDGILGPIQVQPMRATYFEGGK